MGKLYNKLETYGKKENYPMHMPGHKRNLQLLGNKLPYNIDITEIHGFDNLHHPEGIIKEIENKAQKIFSSKRSFILVNRKYLWTFSRNKSSCQTKRQNFSSKKLS